ncbi:MAG: hypothetical protein IKO10_10925 [Lachnospiraceae bacterium]|nr:hypothetical protein [Lachnospiraceae bacterium]
MKVFKPDEKQQQILEDFFLEETTYFPNHVLLKFLAYFLMSIGSILMLIPYGEIREDKSVLGITAMLFVMGTYFYATQYATYTETLWNKVVQVKELVKYLPVERMQITIFRIRKVLKPCLIYTFVVLALKCGIYYGAYGNIGAIDLLIPVLGMVVYPVVIELFRY